MEIESIFAWKPLSEAEFVENVVIDAHRCSASRIHLGHPTAGSLLLQGRSFRRLRHTHAAASAAERLRCVLGMLNSLEVKVLWPT